MVLLNCTVVGDGSFLSIVIEEWMTVALLKDAIKEKKKNDFKDIDADKLKLFLTKKGGEWLGVATAEAVVLDDRGHLQGFEQMDPKLLIKDPKYFGEGFEPRVGDVHVLVVAQTLFLGKRTRSDEWFINQIRTKRSKVSVDDDVLDRITTYFEMAKFPPLAHPKTRFTKIVERDAYVVIFTELMNKAKTFLDVDTGGDCNMLVTGNPGIGKSRFYLYCIFHLISPSKVEVKELPSFDLVLNYDKEYYKFDAESQEFIELGHADVRSLKSKKGVIRLIEGLSSELAGWQGVSILFASPGAEGIQNFSKVDTFKYIMPVWTLEELREYNSLLQDDLKLSDDVLLS